MITSNFSYHNATDIYNFLIDKFHNDTKKHYFLLDPEDISVKRGKKSPLPIKSCREKHMIAFFPNGSIQTKINICSCAECIKGEFINCSHESGKIIYTNDCSDDEDSDDTDYEECETEDCCYDESVVTEENEIRAECVIDAVNPGSFIALYASPQSFEIFYLCHVVDITVATETMSDDYGHIIEKGVKYLICNYLEKKSERKGRINYKMLKKFVFVLPAQVVYPFVTLGDDLSMSAADYQWLTDSI